MKTKWTKYLHTSRRDGLTLIEVVAAIAILGTILVGVVMAKAKHTRQMATSQRQMVAVRAADELLSAWYSSRQGVPVGAHGVMLTNPSLKWETRVVENQTATRLRARVVRFEVTDMESGDSLMDTSSNAFVAVELLLPDPLLKRKRSAFLSSASDALKENVASDGESHEQEPLP